jgi:hypothetical protein
MLTYNVPRPTPANFASSPRCPINPVFAATTNSEKTYPSIVGTATLMIFKDILPKVSSLSPI